MSWTVEWDESSASGSSMELQLDGLSPEQAAERAVDLARRHGHVRVIADGTRLAAVVTSVQGTIVVTDGEAVEGVLVDAIRVVTNREGYTLRRIH